MKKNLDAFIDYWDERKSLKDLRWLAYVLATAKHETLDRFVSIREGFSKTDAAARKFVTSMWDRRIITLPYHKPDRETGEVYYGRGFIGLTWAQNYKKMGKAIGVGDKLYLTPDLALEPEYATKILFSGMTSGAFRYSNRREPKGRQKLSLFFNSTQENWYGARNIINGDLRKKRQQDCQCGQEILWLPEAGEELTWSSAVYVNKNSHPFAGQAER